MGSGWESVGLISFADGAPEPCDISRAFDNAPHSLVAGTSTACPFHEELQVGQLCLDDAIALQAMGACSKVPSEFADRDFQQAGISRRIGGSAGK